MKKIPEEKLGALFSRIAESSALYLPVEKAGQVNFGRWSPEEKVRLDAVNTVRSPKDLFFPQTEELVDFRMTGKNIEIRGAEPSRAPFVVFGVKGCDVRSLDVLDKVFLADPPDGWYAARRESATIVSLACAAQEQSCFCSVFGIDPASPEGDAVCWLTGGCAYLKARTEKGEKLLKALDDLLEDADETAADGLQAAIRESVSALPFASLSLEGLGGKEGDMLEKFGDPVWKKLSESCLGCGTCTFVCPTCQCYDIRDYDTGHGIQRSRCWDSCMYSDFTLMAHGNSRKTQVERFRQRFMHKLEYFPMNNDGMYSCVGCGRCVRKCPVHMNIVKVIKTLGGKKDDK